MGRATKTKRQNFIEIEKTGSIAYLKVPSRLGGLVWWPRSAIAFFPIFLVFIFNLFILLKIKTKIKTKQTKNRFKTKLKQKQTKIVIKLKLKQNKTQNVLGPGPP